jgi:hypothetical protein
MEQTLGQRRFMSTFPDKNLDAINTELHPAVPPNAEQQHPPPAPQDLSELKSTENFVFWIYAWLGTALSGSAYGLLVMIMGSLQAGALLGILGSFPAMILGFVLAGFITIPFLVTIAIATWALWLNRFRIIAASILGGWTGIIAITSVSNSPIPSTMGFRPEAILAGIVGAVSCPLFIYLLGRRIFFAEKKRNEPKTPWQFTLRDLFVHFTALAVLISLWTSYFASMRDFRNKCQTVPPPKSVIQHDSSAMPND